MKARYYITPQRYPTHDGQTPLSFAVYRGRRFLCYSWSLAGAWVALRVIKRTMRNMIDTPKWPTRCDRERKIHVYLEGSPICECTHGPDLRKERQK